jgi:flagellar motor protein MotB
MNRTSRARWALSFADLSLLLLGFFVLLQANQANRVQTLAGLNSYFGALESPHQADLPADQLFERGEALLSDAGKAKLIGAVRQMLKDKRAIRIQSLGLAPGEHRFDAWDLSAARLGAVARALVAAGLAPERVRIAGLAEQDEAVGSHNQSQTIRLVEAQDNAI